MNEYDLDILRLAGQGFCCSQIIVQLALEFQETDNPGLVRASQGLCDGFPNGKGVCGAVTGTACLLSYYGGKGAAEQQEHEKLPLMLDQLAEWFEEHCSTRYSGISCQQIVGDNRPNSAICGELISDSLSKAITLLVENGFDLEESYE